MNDYSMNEPVALGIDFGGTTVKLGLVQAGGLMQRAESLPTLAFDRADDLLAAILAAIDNLRAMRPDIVAVGAGLPGIVDSRHGIVHHLTNVEGWVNVPLRDLLCMHTGLPAVIENDANAMTYAEWKYGAGRDKANVVCVTLGTGVGGGLILNGDLYRGSQLGAGEIGHMSIDYRGVEGAYGNYGGLEEYVGNAQIAMRAAVAYTAAGQARTLLECTPLLLAEAALQGDEIAQAVWEETGVMIGAALANVVWLINPDTIILGGGVAQAGELIFTPIRKALRERVSPVFYDHLQIVPAQMGSDAGIIGIGTLAIDALSTPGSGTKTL